MISHLGWKLGLCGLLLQGCADPKSGGASTTANSGDTGNSDVGSADTGSADSGDEAGNYAFVDGNDVDVLFVIDNSGSRSRPPRCAGGPASRAAATARTASATRRTGGWVARTGQPMRTRC